MESAFKFIKDNGGITTDANYPYKGNDGTCNKKKSANMAARIIGFTRLPANNEIRLQEAIARQPISVAIDAAGYEFQFYSKGVFAGPCGNDLNHAVAIVGYGGDSKSKYWTVKNSWSKGWGETGYMRMKRNVPSREGLRGIAMQASYPN
ncbi:hypothetical protein IFM89_007614 [Coptis chinensis]|uniref:Peptidase C1A papain C-terminal domain-containing protein n=1 Tax=Coptis chinensis TaxID=261450 RepID=A0A835GY96_9MAGN|nr:hypothetical protein IFM89_007614 [Coptis chinensis]